MAGKLKVLNRVTGKLEEHDDTPETEQLVASSGGDLSFPRAEQIAQLERTEKYGSAGQQALAAVETAGRTATFGAWQGAGTPEEIAGRQRTLREESPGTAFAAQAVGTVAPALAGGALASGAVGAAGGAARLAGAAGVAAEGAVGGLAGEVEEAGAQGRPVSPGLAMLTGIGGEVLGRALPAAIRAGVNRVLPAKSAAAAVTGEAVADVSKSAARKARAQLAEDAFHMPPGPERDAALASTAEHQYARADETVRASHERATQLLDELGKAAPADLEKHVPRTAPGQVRWAADTASELQDLARQAPPEHREALLNAARGLVDAEDADGIWRAAADARKSIRELSAKAPADSDLESQLRRSVEQAQARKAGSAPAPEIESPAIKRAPEGARVLEHDFAGGQAPDFSTWDVSDFAKGKGASKAAGKTAGDYSGGARISQYQRSIVDGLKQNAEFASTGRISGDAGKLGSEPTFVLQPDGTVKLDHGRLRITAAREIGRDDVYGRVVRGKGKSAETVYEGSIKVGGRAPAPEAAPAAPATGALQAADNLLAKGQQDPALFGRAAEGAADLHGSAQPGPGRESSIADLENQLAAAQRWKVGADKARAELAEHAQKLRAAQALRDDTDRAVAATGATKPERKGKRGLVDMLVSEGVEAGIEAAVGHSIPGAGLAIKGAKYLWRSMGDSGQAKVARTVRGMLSPLTSQARLIGAARVAGSITALQRFAGDAPDARSAYESRRNMLAHVQANPQLATDVIASSMAGLAQENPSNFIALSRRMTEGLQYVATNLPPTVAVSLAYPTGVPISDQELRDVADLWNTAIDPSSCMDDIEFLRASTIQMQTLKDVHPDIYSSIRTELLLQSSEDPQSIPSQTKLSLDIMFDADGLGGLFASNEAARYITEARNQSVKRGGARQHDSKGDQESQSTVEAAGVRAVRTGVTNKGTA